MDDDLLYKLQAKIEEIERELSAIGRLSDSPSGNDIRVGVTFTQTTYPTTAGAVFAVHPGSPVCVEAEGQTGTVSAGAGTVYAMQVGSSTVPATGSRVVLFSIGNRWVFLA